MAQDPQLSDRDTLEKILEAAYLYHRGDKDAVQNWLRTPHPDLGGETPMELIRAERYDVLVDLLRTMVAEL